MRAELLCAIYESAKLWDIKDVVLDECDVQVEE